MIQNYVRHFFGVGAGFLCGGFQIFQQSVVEFPVMVAAKTN